MLRDARQCCRLLSDSLSTAPLSSSATSRSCKVSAIRQYCLLLGGLPSAFSGELVFSLRIRFLAAAEIHGSFYQTPRVFGDAHTLLSLTLNFSKSTSSSRGVSTNAWPNSVPTIVYSLLMCHCRCRPAMIIGHPAVYGSSRAC